MCKKQQDTHKDGRPSLLLSRGISATAFCRDSSVDIFVDCLSIVSFQKWFLTADVSSCFQKRREVPSLRLKITNCPNPFQRWDAIPISCDFYLTSGEGSRKVKGNFLHRFFESGAYRWFTAFRWNFLSVLAERKISWWARRDLCFCHFQIHNRKSRLPSGLLSFAFCKRHFAGLVLNISDYFGTFHRNVCPLHIRTKCIYLSKWMLVLVLARFLQASICRHNRIVILGRCPYWTKFLAMPPICLTIPGSALPA